MVRRLKRTSTVENIPDAINCSLTKEFTQIPNELLRNPEISGKSKSLLCLLLSNKEGWKSYITSIKRMMKEGEDAIRSGVSELEEHGYLLRIKYRDKKTKVWRGSFWAYTDIPWKLDIENQKQIVEQSGFEIPEIQLEKINNPDMKNPDPENPDMENPRLIILRSNKTEEREEEKYLNVLLDSENPIAKKAPLEKTPPKHPDPGTYPKPVQEVFNYWQSLKIVRHPASKTRTKGLNQLNTILTRHSVDTVKKSMTRYKELLEDQYSILINEDPYKVGLDQFFGFNGYNKDRITRNLPKLEFVRSWFKECQKEDLTHLMRVRANPYPEITTALKKGFSHKIGKVNGGTHNENAFRKASHLLMDFHSKHKEKLTLQLQKKPGIFASCLIDYLAEAPAKDGSKHPGWLCTDITWNVFKGWLTEKGYYCEEDLC